MMLFWLLPSTSTLLIVTHCYFHNPSHFITEIMFNSSPQYRFITFPETFSDNSQSNCWFVVVFSSFKSSETFFLKLSIDWGKRRSSKYLYLSTAICEAGFSLSGIKWRAAIQPEVSVGTLQNIWTSALRTYLKNNQAQEKRNMCAACWRPLVILLAQAKRAKSSYRLHGGSPFNNICNFAFFK